MIAFLIFYYLFSLFFMIGYVDYDVLSGMKYWEIFLALLIMVISCWVLMPINLGSMTYKNQ